MVNTFNALAIDIKKRKAVFDNVTAGLSGACIKPIALRMVRDVYSVVDVPIIEIGGIMNYEDAIEFIMAGATAVQVGTANFLNPRVMIEIIEGMEDFCKRENIKGLKEKYGEFYYNIILSRVPYEEDIEFLNKLEWTDYKDFLKGNIDIEKNAFVFADRIRRIGYILKDVPISETDLIEQLEEIIELNKNLKKLPVNLCESWLEKLKSGVKVKEL